MIFLLSCAAPKAPSPREGLWLPARKESLSILSDDSERRSLQEAVENSLAYLEKKSSLPKSPDGTPGDRENLFHLEKVHGSLSLFREILLGTPDPDEFARRVQENFYLWEPILGGQEKTVLLTGYYEPVISGSLEGGEEYRYPIYRRPPDLIEMSPDNLSAGQKAERRLGRMEGGKVVPYYARREIDSQGVLQGKGYELVWLKDPWERFVLHVQGSGQVRLSGGEILRVGFAGSNGRPYRSIGRYLVAQGLLAEEELSLVRVKEFMQKYPEKREEVLNQNERYIFFRLLGPSGEEQGGPLGALDFPLTPDRSIATDHAIFPPGALAYLISRQPIFDERGKMIGWKPIRRFVLNQDMGAAMIGPARVDLFCGSGERAGWVAGEMREEAEIYLLLAR